jgi:hydrogenase nickel incorporation protein HypA/HybF
MHETSLIRDIVAKIESVAKEAGGGRVTSVSVKLGALCHCSPDHFREHWVEEAAGSVAEKAELVITELHDENDPLAQEIILESFEVEEC